MNNFEFDKEFDILYDNISSNGAPGLNIYEKSIFLTRAQEELVKDYYHGVNIQNTSLDGNEDKRRGLEQLIEDYKTTEMFTNNSELTNDSKFFEVPEDLFYIIQESVKLNSSNDSCDSGRVVGVKPITYDEYNVSKKNPFRKPNKRKNWRLDISKRDGKRVVEIISVLDVSEYRIRYVKKPTPIVLGNFEENIETQGMELTVDGVNTNTECQLNSEIHREILNRAVEMAIRAYRENTLQANVELNKNNV